MGQPLFDTDDLAELLRLQVTAAPVRPSERLGRRIDPDLEELILQCLAKDRRQRPPSAQTLSEALARCPTAAHWTQRDAAEWWRQHLGQIKSEVAAPALEKTLLIRART